MEEFEEEESSIGPLAGYWQTENDMKLTNCGGLRTRNAFETLKFQSIQFYSEPLRLSTLPRL